VPGSPAIAQTILEKIDQCSLFLCDVTFIARATNGRALPNPNVLIELGYAVARKGWERIICVMNEEYGGPSKLPFDLQHRRWPIQYRLAATANEGKITDERERLSQAIEHAIRTAIQSGLLVPIIDPKDRRLAIRLGYFTRVLQGTFFLYLREAELIAEQDVSLLLGHADKPGTRYPDPILVEPTIKLFAEHSLTKSSSTTYWRNPFQVPWIDMIVHTLKSTAAECDKLFSQFADRNEVLLSLVEELGNRARGWGSAIELAQQNPESAAAYNAGLRTEDIDQFRYLLLLGMKIIRVVEQFGADPGSITETIYPGGLFT
jgi:hypothetical protein